MARSSGVSTHTAELDEKPVTRSLGALRVRCRHTKRNTTVSPDGRVEVRIGINVDQIIVEDGDIFGDV
jgi:hypothetical protein